MSRVVLVLVMLLFVWSCSGGSNAGQQATGGHKQEGTLNSTVKNSAAAVVNGTVIPIDKLTARLKALKDGGREVTPETRKKVLDELIRFELVLQETKKSGLFDSDGIKKKMKSYKENIVVTAFVKKNIQDKVSVKDSQVKEYYEINKEKLFNRKTVQASHILVEEKKEAERVLKLYNDGADFAGLAKKYSIDPTTKDLGGDLGEFSNGVMVKSFENAVFSLKEGEVSKPVKTRFGYHLIKVVKKFPNKLVELSEVESKVRKLLIDNAQMAEFMSFTDDLKQKSKIEVSE